MKVERNYSINGVILTKEQMMLLGRALKTRLEDVSEEKRKVLQAIIAKLGRSIKHDA